MHSFCVQGTRLRHPRAIRCETCRTHHAQRARRPLLAGGLRRLEGDLFGDLLRPLLEFFPPPFGVWIVFPTVVVSAVGIQQLSSADHSSP